MREKTLIIIKPDAVNRCVVGSIVNRFERKGLKIIGMKMSNLTEDLLEEHYAHLKDKPFFPTLKAFMRSSPALLMVLEGKNVVEIVRKMAGPTHGGEALPGTIRGDYTLSNQNNVVHASDSVESANNEVARFFKEEELFDYKRIDTEFLYSEDEMQ